MLVPTVLVFALVDGPDLVVLSSGHTQPATSRKPRNSLCGSRFTGMVPLRSLRSTSLSTPGPAAITKGTVQPECIRPHAATRLRNHTVTLPDAYARLLTCRVTSRTHFCRLNTRSCLHHKIVSRAQGFTLNLCTVMWLVHHESMLKLEPLLELQFSKSFCRVWCIN